MARSSWLSSFARSATPSSVMWLIPAMWLSLGLQAHGCALYVARAHGSRLFPYTALFRSGVYRLSGGRCVVPLAGHGLRPTALRRRAGRPQLKRDPLGGSGPQCAGAPDCLVAVLQRRPGLRTRPVFHASTIGRGRSEEIEKGTRIEE